MKRILLTLAFVLSFTILCSASTIKLAWDAMPTGQSWTAVRVYELANGVYTKVGEVAGNLVTATLTNVSESTHVYVVRSFDGTNESVDSNSVIVPALPVPPTGLKYTITIQLSGTTTKSP